MPVYTQHVLIGTAVFRPGTSLTEPFPLVECALVLQAAKIFVNKPEDGPAFNAPHRPYFYNSVKFVASNMELTLLFVEDDVVVFGGTGGFEGEVVIVFGSSASERDVGVGHPPVWDP